MLGYLYAIATDNNKSPAAYPVKLILYLFSLIYGLIVRILITVRGLGRRHFPCKLISVGNITVGGTGKTPLVELVASRLAEKGRRVAVISRSYAKTHIKTGREFTDESLMLSRRLKGVTVLTDKDRAAATDKAIQDYNADTVIYDDGLQQWHIHKDLEIVTIDSGNPFGNGHLLPRGLLRQPIETLDKADIFILTKVNIARHDAAIKDRLKKLNPAAAIFEAEHQLAGIFSLGRPQEIFDAAKIKDKRLLAFSGIADPSAFLSLARGVGLKIASSVAFADHHSYTIDEIKSLASRARGSEAEALITTEKDAARLSFLGGFDCGVDIFVARLKLKIRDEHEFLDRLYALYPL